MDITQLVVLSVRYLQAEKKATARSSTFIFLPTLKANTQKNKRACPSPPPPKLNGEFNAHLVRY
jgi:hypothetical protein